MREVYRGQVDLLLEAISYALQDPRVALKGGTAINLFHRNFPRLSVDIDLCYLPLEDRPTSFQNIHGILQTIKTSLETNLGLTVFPNVPLDGKKEAKLFVKKDSSEIKIEPNFTLRSSLFEPEDKKLSKGAEKEFNKSMTVKCLNIADTYGGKICAALDRQHPRDLFDVKQLLENEGINTDIKDSFLFYLLSHGRPIDELLKPNMKDISKSYKEEFVDMALETISEDELIIARTELVDKIKIALTETDKKFLIGFAANSPDWDLYRDKKIQEFPSIKWKMQNQGNMKAGKRAEYLKKIEASFK